jgi:hypothetical protein
MPLSKMAVKVEVSLTPKQALTVFMIGATDIELKANNITLPELREVVNRTTRKYGETVLTMPVSDERLVHRQELIQKIKHHFAVSSF